MWIKKLIDFSFSMEGILRNVSMNAQPIIDEISKKIDLRKFSTVYVYHPPGLMDFKANLILRNAGFKIKEGNSQLKLLFLEFRS